VPLNGLTTSPCAYVRPDHVQESSEPPVVWGAVVVPIRLGVVVDGFGNGGTV